LHRRTAEVLRPRDRQERTFAEQAAAGIELRAERHAAEVRSVDVRNAVLPREPLVDERIVGRQQIDDVAIFADDALEEQLHLALVALSQLVVPIGIKDAVWRRRRKISQIQELRAEVVDER